MHFSLIMATLGRKDEVDRFCKCLAEQTHKDFELIVVDQNEENFLADILLSFSSFFKLIHIRSSIKGLSHNRNIGLQKARGDVIAFPDDDCWYEPHTLEYVEDAFKKTGAGYFAFNLKYHSMIAYNADYPVFSIRSFQNKKRIESRDFYYYGLSVTVFVKRELLGDFKFDEQLGCGAKFGSGEDSDLLLYCIKNHLLCIYDGTFFIHHPYKPIDLNNSTRSKNYALGFGAVHKKAFYFYKNRYAIRRFVIAVLKNILGIIISKNRKHHFIALQGKIVGFVQYRVEVIKDYSKDNALTK